eukprot:TRINITY_DN1794_c0_g2_i1.p1 TRINITY_DN1794_c0_g2~~TRINITY_DN1794_c0_g2_i1.p1  ORF type:complete len:250 (-),score=41.79 TRINITY_DN1794_c0_g2_i1:50-799(-)
MSSIGTGYDLSATTYSPDGRVFQVEYANKAVENSGTAIAIKVKDGIIFGVEKIIISKMLVENSNRRVYGIDLHAGLAVAGLVADARQIVNRARQDALEYKNFYGEPIPIHVLVERVSAFVQAYTLYSHMRPFGAAVLIGGFDKSGPQLFKISPSGESWGYFGCAAGKGKQLAKTEIEKLKLSQLTCQEALVEVARIIHVVHDEVKDKDFELELAWICDKSKNVFEVVPKDIRDRAEKEAKARLENDMDD